MSLKMLQKIGRRRKDPKWTLTYSSDGEFSEEDLIIISELIERVYIDKTCLSERDLKVCEKILMLIQTAIHKR